MLSDVKTFSETNALGKTGERIVLDFLKGQGYQVEDLSDDLDWQGADVDLSIEAADGKKVYGEIKTDTEMWMTGNIFLEISMERQNSGITAEGWYSYSLADQLYYLCAGTGKLYVLPFAQLRSYVDDGHGKYVRFRNRTDSNTVGSGVLLNVSELLEDGIIAQAFDINTKELWPFAWRKPVPF